MSGYTWSPCPHPQLSTPTALPPTAAHRVILQLEAKTLGSAQGHICPALCLVTTPCPTPPGPHLIFW